MKISTFFKEAATDVAAVVGGGAALVGVGIGTAAAIGGVPLIAAGAALGGAVAAPTIVIGRVASHIIDGIQSKFDPDHQHNAIARTLKVLSFGVGLAAGAGVAAGIACIPALGLTVATAASIIGAVALAAAVGYVAYLVLRGACNLIAGANAPAVPPAEAEQLVPPQNEEPALRNNRERRDYIIAQINGFPAIENMVDLTDEEIENRLPRLTSDQRQTLKNCAAQVRGQGYFTVNDQDVYVTNVQAFLRLTNMHYFPTQDEG